VVTSPPYYGLRDYNVAGQLGLEETPQEYVVQLRNLFREVRRILKPDGTCWLNLGDSYANDAKWGGHSSGLHVTSANQSCVGNLPGNQRKRSTGFKQKELMGMPWRVAFALQDEGWYLRSDIIWQKPNCLPESVKDRPTKSHEYVFLLTKSPHYYYDGDSIRERRTSDKGDRKSFRGGGTYTQNNAFDNWS